MTPSAYAELTRIRVADGTLVGRPEGKVAAFRGVPYASPPTGIYRWTAPRPPKPWTGELAADQFAASCQQTITPDGFGPWTKEYVVEGKVSEDCLYLNIWTPAHNADERLPVLFWIHGGGFSSGSGSVPIYNGAALASQGVVVVSVNYRVGVYGFLAHPDLTSESTAHVSGNYGILDQIAALEWIRANIPAFGGDPGRVTVAGQSAGAASVHILISSPLATGLFSQAIAQSGSGMGLPTPDRSVAEATGRRLSNAGDVSLTLAQLRALSTSDLDARVARMPSSGTLGLQFVPCVDGQVLPNAAALTINTNDTPILTGMTAHEVSGLNPSFGHASAANFAEQLRNLYGSMSPRFAALYPARTDGDAVVQFESHARDRGLAAMYLWAANRLPHTRHPIYAYLWTHVEPGPDAARYKAFHSSEIPYVFDVLETSRRPFTGEDRSIAARMSRYWVNFVKTGDPNGWNLPTWPALRQADKQIMELGESARPRTVLSPEQLKTFEQYARNGGNLSLF